jgi:WS/DGAT/MGAT family acyltransferase
MAVVDRLDDGGMAIVWRVHHALADGTTCVRLASTLLWDRPADPDPDGRSAWRAAPAPSRRSLLASGLTDRAARLRRHRLRAPSLTSVEAGEKVVARELRPSASTTELDARAGSTRSVAFASVPFQPLRQAGKAISESVTINDLALSIVAGGVRGWLGSDASIRVKVPVSLHDRDPGVPLSNHDSYFFVDLPVDEPDAVQRVLAINRETTERKVGHDAETLYHLGTHPAIAHWAMSPHVFTFNVSNVKGPQDDVFVLGARLRELWSLAEIAQHHALRIAVISAAGSLFFGLCADREAVPDLDGLASGIHDCARDLLNHAAAAKTPRHQAQISPP